MNDDKNDNSGDQKKEELQNSGYVATEGIQIDQPTEEQQPSDQTETEFREISNEELKQMLEDHKKWVESDGKEGEKADLSYADLEGLDLSELDLRYAKFIGAVLKGADLQEANLSYSNLEGAKLNNSNIKKANF